MNRKITFPELIDLMARKQNCSKRDAENFLRELMLLMTDTVSSGETLRINSLGTFKSVWVEDRASVNVHTGEPNLIPGHYKLTFTPTKAVRDAVNEPFACFAVEVLPDDAPILLSEDSIHDNAGSGDADVEEAVADDITTTTATDEVVVDVQSALPKGSNEGDTVEYSDAMTEEQPYDNPSAEEVVLPVVVDDIAGDVTDEDTEKHEEVELPTSCEVLDPEADDGKSNDTHCPEEDIEEKMSTTYRRGMWVGIAVTTTIFVLLLLSLYLYMTHYKGYTLMGDKEVAVTTPLSSVGDTAVVVEEQQDAVVGESDTLQHSLLTDTLLVPLQPVVTDTIQKGVFLTGISLRHYGHKAFWVYIYEENKETISNPDLIPIGTVVVIPPPEKYGINPSDTLSVNKALSIADEIKAQKK